MMKYMALGLAAAVCGCQSNHEYARIGYGPEQHLAEAECEIRAMGVEQGMWAWGSPEYVLGAQIGNAIGNEIRKQQFMKNCMTIKGWGQQPPGTHAKGAAAVQRQRAAVANAKASGQKFPPAPNF